MREMVKERGSLMAGKLGMSVVTADNLRARMADDGFGYDQTERFGLDPTFERQAVVLRCKWIPGAVFGSRASYLRWLDKRRAGLM